MFAVNQAHVLPWPDTSLPATGTAVADSDRAAWAVLLDRMATGDANACVALYDRSATAVFSLIVHLVSDRQTAEDVLRELYVDLMQRAARGEHREYDAVAWVLSVARTAALARRRTTASAATAPSYAADDRSAVANALLDPLDEEQRAILRMIYFGGLTAREAAARLGQPVPQVIRQLHAALSRLRASSAGLPAGTRTPSGRYRVATPRGSSASPA